MPHLKLDGVKDLNNHRLILDMNLSRMTDALPAIIPGCVSADDMAAVTGYNNSTCEKILDMMADNHIGRLSEGGHVFDLSDRLAAALLLISKGAQVDDVAVHLDWRTFEGLTAKILEEKGFAVSRNVIMTGPKMEIDVIGSNLGVSVLVDCKHWSRRNTSGLRDAVKKQVVRTKRYVGNAGGTMAVPVIVTLYKENVDFIERVPIVPIQQFSSFVDELYGNLEDLKSIETGSQ